MQVIVRDNNVHQHLRRWKKKMNLGYRHIPIVVRR
ncbi:hypothetical protein EV130_102500 [Rhizobium azibense]|uniref:Uncharacterized protein n=1 Tax=Rhizobium azibense TaxID=1136135 RepID=A0A4R3R2T7_9HYPH|nr:hypothetical protein EV130_102500 [Rhizobium azibense]